MSEDGYEYEYAVFRRRKRPPKAAPYGWHLCEHPQESPRSGVCPCERGCACQVEGNCGVSLWERLA